MKSRAEFIHSVEKFLGREKSLVGVGSPPQWQPNRDGSGHETRVPIEVAGVQYGDHLIIWCVPQTGAFHILITRFEACVSRLDFDDLQGHTNTLLAAEDGLPWVVSGRHFHRWSINRRFVMANGSLERLKHAEELPAKIRSFEQALRWFCHETNIILPHDHYITLPELLI